MYVEDWRRERDTRKGERTLFTEGRIAYKEKEKEKYENLSLTQQPEREKKIIASQKINII